MCKEATLKLIIVLTILSSYLFAIDFSAIEDMKHKKEKKRKIKVSLDTKQLARSREKAKKMQTAEIGFAKTVESAIKTMAETSVNLGTSVSNTYCSPREVCYNIIKKDGKRTEIKCRNGFTCYIDYDSDNGKYYISGFLLRTYDTNFKKLANYACGVY